MKSCDRRFYSRWRVLRRVVKGFLRRRRPILSLVTNMSYRNNVRLARKAFAGLDLLRGNLLREESAAKVL